MIGASSGKNHRRISSPSAFPVWIQTVNLEQQLIGIGIDTLVNTLFFYIRTSKFFSEAGMSLDFSKFQAEMSLACP